MMIVIYQHLDQNYLQKDHLKKAQGNKVKPETKTKIIQKNKYDNYKIYK